MGDASSCRVDIGKAEDARRIVACVNACKGIPTEILESHGDGTGGLLDVMGIKPGEMDAELTRIRVSDAGQWALK